MSSCLEQAILLTITLIAPGADLDAIGSNINHSLETFRANSPDESPSQIISDTVACEYSTVTDYYDSVTSELIERFVLVVVVTVIVCVSTSMIISNGGQEALLYIVILFFVLFIAVVVIFLSPLFATTSTCGEEATRRGEIFLFQFYQAINSALCAY